MTASTHDTDNDTGRAASSDRALGWLLTIGGAIGLFSAAKLIIEKINYLKNPGEALGCDLNAFVSCGGVINTDQAAVFGFPNPLLGVVGFAVVVTMGVLALSRTPLPKFMWLGLQAGAVFGISLITWLQWQSLYEIGKLCPWCMVVWTVMIAIFVWLTARNLREYAPNNPVSRIVVDWTLLINLLWYVVIIAAIWFKFGSNLWA
jgi:uncharacterized membrane protein